MHTTNYFNTLIRVSPDCPVLEGDVPTKLGTIASLQYEKLIGAPYRMTSDALLFEIHAERNNIAEDELSAAREAFFSKGQPCMRSSPLVKRHGWGVHFDAAGKIALCGAGSARYQELVTDDGVNKIVGMRLRRVNVEG